MLFALEHLVESAQRPRIAIAAYSFGCWPALLLASRDTRVDRLLLVAPPRKLLALPDYGKVLIPVTVVLGDKDELVDLALEKELAAREAPRVRLEVLRDADHTLRSA